MSVFSHEEFDNHEQVNFLHDRKSGLRAIIAIHNTHLGPALGGCRMWPYNSDHEALTDVLRLSRGMTYKSALAGLPLGGGKCVIIGDPHKDKTEALFYALGDYIQGMSGSYITAEDSGTSVADIALVAEHTQYCTGISGSGPHGGDPSPYTALGVFSGIKSAVRHRLGRDHLTDIKIAIQGVGHVGLYLAKLLEQAGAILTVCDIYQPNLDQAADELNAQVVDPDTIYDLDVDVFAPCALGGTINRQTVERLQASIIAGSANNQLAHDELGQRLVQKEILYAPDYVINAGGIIDIALEQSAVGEEAKLNKIEAIGQTLRDIFLKADAKGIPTTKVADQIAEERLKT